MSDQHPDAEQVTDPQRVSPADQTSQAERTATEQDTPVEQAPTEHGDAADPSQAPPKAPRARRRSASRPAGPPAHAPAPPAAPPTAAAEPQEQSASSVPEPSDEPAAKQAPRRPARKRVTRAQAPAEAKIEVESSAPAAPVAEPVASETHASKTHAFETHASEPVASEPVASEPVASEPESASAELDATASSQHSDIPNPFAQGRASAPAEAGEEHKPARSRRRPTKRISDPFAAPEAVPAERKTETTQPDWASEEESGGDESTTQESTPAQTSQRQSTQGQSPNDSDSTPSSDSDSHSSDSSDPDSSDSDSNDSDSSDSDSNDSDSSDSDSNDSDSRDSDADDSDDPNRRRRRRRGGRRRRRGGDAENSSSGDDSEESSDDTDQSEASSGGGRRRGGRQSEARPDQSDSGSSDGSKSSNEDNSDEAAESNTGPSSEGENGESTSSRRRRRRRRRGEDDSASSEDDPADVVTRVREPRNRRKASDEVTGIEGSTRMEAKRQRRRDGRTASRRRSPILSESEFLSRRESVDRRMIIRQAEGLAQLAVIEDGALVEHYVDRDSAASLIGNVYLGRVQNVLPSMEAAFIDIGRGRNAVLYAGEVDWDSFGVGGKSRQVEKVLKSGQTILVQVTKDPVGAKGARLTNHVSIPGRYIVYAPNGHLSGISRKLPENERRRLKDILGGLVDDSASFIVRTAAEGATEDELVRDVNRLKAQWEAIEKKIKIGQSPQQLYSEPDLTVRIVRDLFTEDFSELIISGNGGGNDAYDTVDAYVAHVAPHLKERMTRWDGADGDVFSAHRLNEQIAKALERKVFLPSGGSLVIDRTEAMTVVDVNTGKFTGSGGNLEATVTSNNLEAAEEVVRQLRLRDIGGIIVVDFIDMVLPSNRELLLRRLVECLGRDRTRHQVAEVTSLGLVQLTRKKIGTGLAEAFTEPCECCDARGYQTFDMPVDSQDQADGGQRSSRGGRRGGGGGGGGNRGGNQNSGNQNQGSQNQGSQDQGGQNQGNQNQGGQNQGGQDQGKQGPPKPGDHRTSRSNGAASGSEQSVDIAAADNTDVVTTSESEGGPEAKPSQGKSKSGKSKAGKSKSGKSSSGKSKSKSGKTKSEPALSEQAPSEQAQFEPAQPEEMQPAEIQPAEMQPGEAQAEAKQPAEATPIESRAPKSRPTRSRRGSRASADSGESAAAPVDDSPATTADDSPATTADNSRVTAAEGS